MTTIQALRRVFACTAAIALTATTMQAQDVDARWRAWTGCWTTVAGSDMPGKPVGTVCVLPAAGNSAVDIVSISGSKIIDRTHIDADGAEHPVSHDGCTGTRAARWSETGTRVYLRESLTCGSLARVSTGVMSFDPEYQWLDVRGISTGTTQGVAVARYEVLLDSAGLPAEVMPAFALRGPAANNAILAASAPLTLADIADVATAADTGVATTWLVERNKNVSLAITGKQLEALADQGVAPPVIDVIVALAYPKNFAFDAGMATAVQQPAARRSVVNTDRDTYRYSDPYLYDPYGLNSDWYYRGYGFGYPYYYYSSGYYSPYSYYIPYYSPYGYYPGSGPVIVVNGSGGGGTIGSGSSSHGRVTRSGGYTRGGGSSSGTAGPSTSRTSGSTSSGSASSGSAGSSSSSGSSSGGGRVAVRKPPE